MQIQEDPLTEAGLEAIEARVKACTPDPWFSYVQRPHQHG